MPEVKAFKPMRLDNRKKPCPVEP